MVCIVSEHLTLLSKQQPVAYCCANMHRLHGVIRVASNETTLLFLCCLARKFKYIIRPVEEVQGKQSSMVNGFNQRQ